MKLRIHFLVDLTSNGGATERVHWVVNVMDTYYRIWTPYMGTLYKLTWYLIWAPNMQWAPYISAPYNFLYGHLISYLYLYGSFLVQATFAVWHFTVAAAQTTICHLFVFVVFVFVFVAVFVSVFVFALFVFLWVLGASNICWVTCHRGSTLLPRKS